MNPDWKIIGIRKLCSGGYRYYTDKQNGEQTHPSPGSTNKQHFPSSDKIDAAPFVRIYAYPRGDMEKIG